MFLLTSLIQELGHIAIFSCRENGNCLAGKMYA